MSLSLPYALAVWRRNAVMYKRTWKWNILPNFFEPVLYLFSIGIGVGAYISEIGGTSYIAFLAPGLISVAAMNGASFEVTYNIYVRLVFEKTYDAMPDPRLVVAVGACGCSGGIFGANYATVGSVDAVIPVDVYIPGCPPNPYALLQGILLAMGRIYS